MDSIKFVGLIVGISMFGLVVMVFLLMIIEVYQIDNNEEQHGERLTNYNLGRKNACIDFCGAEDVWFRPSVTFTQEVCQCRPAGVDWNESKKTHCNGWQPVRNGT